MLYKGQSGHSLEKLIARHDIPYSARHRAQDDARAILFFAQLAYEEHGETAFAAAVSHQLKAQYTPLGLEQARLQAIENTPGVYIFKGDDGVVLYVGKSIDMKKRVISHFQDMSAREVKLASKVKSIETIPTGTELLALLLESRLVKALSPVFNIQLRRVSSYCMAVRDDVDGFPTLKLIEGVPDSGMQLDAIYGMYDTRTKAKKWLDIITRTYGLCPKLMGLEKTKGNCFNASLGKCHGACAGRESAKAYTARFLAALEKARIATWPYPGPVSVELEGGGTMTVDNWVITQLDSPVSLTADLTTRRFDLDEYKILRSFFARRPVGLRSLV
jgi:DNA polymerase-3 subunit epsilon